MTTPSPRADAIARLTGPGAPFEVRSEAVLGTELQVFARAERSLGELLETSAAHGAREYLVSGSRRLSFADHLRAARATAESLRRDHGIAPGDRVAVFALNSPDWVIAFWAAASIGAVVVAGNSMGVPVELQHQIDLTTPSLVLTDAELHARLGACDLGERPVRRLDEVISAALLRYPDATASPAVVDPDDPAVIVFTSGTTGRPKGATHSHRNLITAVWFHLLNDAIATELGTPPPRRRYLLASPMFHIASLHNLAVVRLVTGDAVVILPGRFDGRRALELISTERITNWGAVPTMIRRVLAEDLEAHDLSSLVALTVNSAASGPLLQDEVRRRLPAASAGFGTSYGLTESSSAATLGTPAMLSRDPSSVGVPVVTMDVEIRGKDGARLPDGTEGEIHLRGPLVMLGYWGAGERAGVDADGWFPTGDLGVVRDGELRLRARRSDLINRGGQNVYPAEVESAIADYPGVRESAVFGVPDPDYGQRVAAIVVVADPDAFDAAGLEAHLRARLSKYKRPARIRVCRDPLPRNPTGKVMRRKLDTSFAER